MGDYEPRGRTHQYGRHEEAPEEPPIWPPPGPESEFAGFEPPPPPPEEDRGPRGGEPESDERQVAMFAHLGGVLGWLVSGGFIAFLVPLVIWLTKKDSSDFIDDQGREALNFQLTALILSGIFFVVTVVLGFLTLGVALCPLGALAVLYGIYVIVFGIIAGLQASDGERYRYPFCIRVL